MHTFNNGAIGRNRTGTRDKPRRILSPVRLPVPPQLLVSFSYNINYYILIFNFSQLYFYKKFKFFYKKYIKC